MKQTRMLRLADATRAGRRMLARTLLAGALAGLLAACQFPASSIRNEPAPSAADAETVERTAREAYDRQDWAQAEQQYLTLTTKEAASAEPWFRLGNIYARTDRADLAVRAYREAIARDPKHARAWHNMGIVQLQQAAASFGEIEKVASRDDPLYARSAEIRASIQALIAPRGAAGR